MILKDLKMILADLRIKNRINMKKLLLTLLILGSYSQSHAMLARHAHRTRVFNQIKKALCSTQVTHAKSSGSFWKLLFGFCVGASTTHALYETYNLTEEEDFSIYCPYKKTFDKLNKLKYQEEYHKETNEK